MTVDGSRLTPTAASPWQLTAPEGSAAFSRMDLLTAVLHEMGHVLGLDDQAALRLGSGQAQPGVRRLPGVLEVTGGSSFVNRQARVESKTSHENLIDRLLSGSRTAFAGVWGVTGTGLGSPGAEPASPVIDWREDEEGGDLHHQTKFKTAPSKTSWLSRFLFQADYATDQPDHGIEVVLPGKK